MIEVLLSIESIYTTCSIQFSYNALLNNRLSIISCLVNRFLVYYLSKSIYLGLASGQMIHIKYVYLDERRFTE